MITTNSTGIVKMQAANAPTNAPAAAPNGAKTRLKIVFNKHGMPESHMQKNVPKNPTSIGTTTNTIGVKRSKRKSFVKVKH